eukprot:m51a1_g9336 hypothetical protein (4370) ;mRNA; r:36058-55372
MRIDVAPLWHFCVAGAAALAVLAAAAVAGVMTPGSRVRSASDAYACPSGSHTWSDKCTGVRPAETGQPWTSVLGPFTRLSGFWALAAAPYHKGGLWTGAQKRQEPIPGRVYTTLADVTVERLTFALCFVILVKDLPVQMLRLFGWKIVWVVTECLLHNGALSAMMMFWLLSLEVKIREHHEGSSNDTWWESFKEKFKGIGTSPPPSGTTEITEFSLALFRAINASPCAASRTITLSRDLFTAVADTFDNFDEANSRGSSSPRARFAGELYQAAQVASAVLRERGMWESEAVFGLWLLVRFVQELGFVDPQDFTWVFPGMVEMLVKPLFDVVSRRPLSFKDIEKVCTDNESLPKDILVRFGVVLDATSHEVLLNLKETTGLALGFCTTAWIVFSKSTRAAFILRKISIDAIWRSFRKFTVTIDLQPRVCCSILSSLAVPISCAVLDCGDRCVPHTWAAYALQMFHYSPGDNMNSFSQALADMIKDSLERNQYSPLQFTMWWFVACCVQARDQPVANMTNWALDHDVNLDELSPVMRQYNGLDETWKEQFQACVAEHLKNSKIADLVKLERKRLLTTAQRAFVVSRASTWIKKSSSDEDVAKFLCTFFVADPPLGPDEALAPLVSWIHTIDYGSYNDRHTHLAERFLLPFKATEYAKQFETISESKRYDFTSWASTRSNVAYDMSKKEAKIVIDGYPKLAGILFEAIEDFVSNVAGIHLPNLDDLIKTHEELKRRHSSLILLYNWIAVKGVKLPELTADRLRASDDTPITELSDNIEAILANIQPPMDAKTIETICFFLERKCALFSACMDRLWLDNKTSPSLENIQVACGFTEERLRRLIEGKTNFTEIQPLHEVISSMQRSVESELKVTQEYFYHDSASKDLPPLINYVSGVLCNQSDVDKLRRDVESITVDLEMKLVQELHQRIRGAIGNLTLAQLPYFTTIGKASELVSFCRSHAEDFEGRIAHLNAQLQGYKFSLDLINALVVVRGTLHPILEAFACSDPMSIPLKELCDSVASAFRGLSAVEIRSRLEQVLYVVALHVNVSAYAPLDEVESLFSNLLLWNMVSDPASGEIVYIRPGSVVWHIFVEFAVAPEGDEEYAQRTSMDQVLACVPTLTWMQSAEVGKPASEYCLNDDALLVAKCLRHHVADMERPEADRATAGVFASVPESGITLQEAMDVINRFLVSLKSNSRLAQRRAVELMATRCRLLVEYCAAVARTDMWLRKYGGTWGDRAKSNPPFLYMTLFIEEAVKASSTPIHPSLVCSVCEPSTEDEMPPIFSVLDFSGDSSSIATRFSGNVFTTADALQSEAILRVKLAHGLGCKRTQNVCKLFEQQGYVLTPDFATKMILLNDMMRANQNVILTGDTGVGKTELLNMLALLVNEDSGMIPDLMDAAYRFLDTLCEGWNRISAADKARLRSAELHRSTPKMMLDFLSLVVRMSPVLSDEERAEIEKHPQDVDEAEDNAPNKVMMQLLSRVIIEFVSSQVQEHPNIRKSAVMKRVLKAGSMCFADEEEMRTFFEHFCVAKFKGVFHRILMHQRITAAEFKRQVNDIRSRTRLLNGGKAIVFIDECTSTQVMGLLKEVFIDGMIEGEKIEENIFWVAAMNQNKSDDADNQPARKTKVVTEDHTGIAESERNMEFAVRPPPPSLQLQTIEFAALSHEQTEHFVSCLLELRSKVGENVGSPYANEGEMKSHRDQVKSFVMLCHEFVARQNISRIHVSIRDLVRCIDLYSYFRRHTQLFAGSDIIADLPPEDSELYEHWNALIMSCAMAYYLRLPSIIRTCAGRDEQPRKLFAEEFDKRAAESRCPGLRFHEVVHGAMAKLFENTTVPDGIAPTEILLENLFCVVVCIDVNIALIIVGPPGCSKTLSFKIAIDNMKGSQSPRPFYKQFVHAHPFRYQCSEQSTDTEIKSTYVSATSRQETFDSSRIGQSRQRCVVLLDEAGLPSERKASLKVVHYELDRPVVASVILSNKVLDAAKTNRAIMVLQSKPSQDDLLSLARGCIFGSKYASQTAAWQTQSAQQSRIPLTERANSLVSALCSAYQKVNSLVEAPTSSNPKQDESGMFHLRDFVYFLRFLGRACNSGGNVEIRPDAIAASLQRNFGGVDRETFSKIVELFFSEIGGVLSQEHLRPSASVLERGTVETLRDSLNEVISDTEDPNTAPFRFVMVIDPTDNEVAKDLLFSLGLCNPEQTCVVSVGDFREDTGEVIRGDTILDIKNAMATGRTVLLTNALPISTSFYDVFNRHFDVLPMAHDAQLNASSSRRCEWYANVAVGSFSRPCYVHPDFRIIVHLPLSQLRRTPRPFLNRFEKYVLSPRDALQYQLRSLEAWQRRQFDTIHASCLAFIEKAQPSLFYGLVPNDTVASLVLMSLEETRLAHSSQLRMPPPFVSGSPDAEFTKDAEKSSTGSPRVSRVEEDLKSVVRQINFHLLQLARPEMVFFSDVLPEEYLFEYIMRQEHLSVLRLLERLAVTSTPHPQPQASKWCVFTRSCGDLMRLHTDVAVQNSFLEPLLRGSSGMVSDKLALISVHEVKSSADCASRVADFAKSSAQFLVCTADMSSCTACQINFLRTKIDEFVPASLGKITIVLLHFAPERVVLRSSVYHSVFLNNWSFLYVDSIGVSEGSAFGDSRKADADSRTWLAHAFGLDVEITLDSVMHAFRSLFLHQLHLCCRRLCFVSACGDCVLSRKFYSGTTDPEERYAFLLDLLEKKPFVLEGALKRFSALWGESILADVVQSACREIREGRVMSNLLTVVQSSLRLLLQPIAEEFISLLCNNYALEPVCSITEDTPAERELVCCAINSLVGVPLAEQLIRPGFVSDPPLRFTSDYEFVPRMPMFNCVLARLERLQAGILKREVAARDTPELLLRLLVDATQKDAIEPVLRLMHSSDRLLPLFKHDFLTRAFGLVELASTSAWTSVYLALLERLGASSGSDVIQRLMVTRYFRSRDVAFFATAVSPLRALSPALTEDEMRLLSPEGADITTSRDIEKFVLGSALDVLWGRFVSALRPDTPAQSLLCWAHAFRALRSRLPKSSDLEMLLYVGKCLVDACETLGRPLEAERKRALYEDVVRWVLNTPHSTENYSSAVMSNVALLLVLLVRDEGTVDPRLAPVAEALDIHWCVAFLHSVVGNKDEMWLRGITRALAGFVANSVDEAKAPYAFMADISDPSLANMGRAEYALFHLLHSAQPSSAENIARLFFETDQRQERQTSLPERVLSSVTRAVQASVVVSWCARALSPGDMEKQAQNFPRVVLDVLERIKETNWPCGSRPLFVRSLKDSFALDCLKNERALRVLHMEDLVIDDRSTTIPLYLLPAMVNPQSELHAVIEDVRNGVGDAPALVQRVTALVGAAGTADLRQSIAGKYRMAILLVLFYEYFRHGKSCDVFLPVVQGLRGVLDLTDCEARSYEFFIAGFKNVDPDREIALHLFSERVQKGPLTEELIYSYLMVNVLAVALGCPRNSNHLYCRIFELQKLSGTYGPGSAHDRMNMDCGYRMDENGTLLLDPSPPIMGNSRRLRLVLNTSVWMSICWATLLHPDAPRIALSNDHFLNFVDADAKLFKFDMTPEQKVRLYVQWRAYTFCYWMRQSAREDVDPVHLFNESLQQLWVATDNAGAPSARAPQLVSEYHTKQVAVDYENVLKEKVFDVILSDPEAYEKRKEPYTRFILATGPMAQALGIRKRLGAKLYSPVVSFSEVEERMSRMPSEEQNRFEIVNHFRSQGMRSALRAIRHLPELVHFYAVLNKQFSWLLTEEDVNTKTFRQCVEMLDIAEENKKLLMALWKRFKAAWKEVCESVLPDACDVVMQQRQFELLVLKVDKAVLVGRLISWESSDVDDHIVRMIEKGLASKQESMIRSATKYDTPQFNPSGLVFDSAPQQISFRVLPSLGESNYLLMTGEEFPGEFESYACTQLRVSDTLERTSMRLDATNLVREVLDRYINGKCLFHPIEQFREVFRFKTGSAPAEVPTPSVQPCRMRADDAVPQQDQRQMPGGASRLIYHHMLALEGAVKAIPKGNQFAAEFRAHTVVQNCTQEDLQRIAEALCTVAKECVIPNLNAANAASATFKSTGVAFPPAADGFLGRQLAVFRSIAEAVHTKLVNREYLFSGIVDHRQYNSHSEPLETALVAARERVLADAERIDEWTHAAESLLSMLQEGARDKLGFHALRVHELFSDEIRALTLGAVPVNDIGALLPEDLVKWNFFQYLRWLHGLLGDLIAAGDAKMAAAARKSNVFRRRERRADAQVYEETAHILDSDVAAGSRLFDDTASEEAAPTPPERAEEAEQAPKAKAEDVAQQVPPGVQDPMMYSVFASLISSPATGEHGALGDMIASLMGAGTSPMPAGSGRLVTPLPRPKPPMLPSPRPLL